MNLLLVTQDMPPRPGGMARYYAALAGGLGSPARVAATRWEGAPPEGPRGTTVWDLGVESVRSHRRVARWKAWRSLVRSLGTWEPELIACGNPRPFAGTCRTLSRRYGVPWVVFHHGADILRTQARWSRPLRRRSWKQLLDNPSLHIANSAFTADLLLGFGVLPERIAVVHPEVDTARFRPVADADERNALRREFGLPHDGVLTLFVGRLVRRKGVDHLIRELAALPRTNHLVVAGPGEHTAWMNAAREAGVVERVRFLGPVPDERLPGLYRCSDLFASPARERREAHDVEGFGIVYLEAAASGLPVLATDTGGVAEAVAGGLTGVVVPAGDPGALREAWLDLVQSPARRERLASAGPEHAARFGPGTSARSLMRALADRGIPAARPGP